jgi:hypothetical protein
MSAKFSSPRVRAPHAYTDLYDEQRHAFRVQYPIPLVVALGLTGIAAFMITGFLGYKDPLEPSVTHALFGKPWPLYLWFCALILTLQISILRHPSLRTQLIRTLSVTMFCIIFVGVFDIYRPEILNALQNFLSYLTNTRVLLQDFGQSPWTYTVINFGILAIYWLDTLRRWVRASRGQSPFKAAEIGLESDTETAGKQSADNAPPSTTELISGDLMAGAFLTLLLSLFFHASVINFLANGLQPGSANGLVNTFTLSWPIGSHMPGSLGGGMFDPPTLTFMDLIQTLVYLPLGLIILALTAVIAGLSVPEGVTGVQQRGAGSDQAQGERGAQGVAGEVGMAIFKALQAALTRRVRIAADNFAVSLRSVIWPVLILIGTFAVAGAAESIQQYLHLLSDQRTCGTSVCSYFGDVQRLLDAHQQLTSPPLALLWGILAVVSIVISASLQLFQLRVAENSLRFLGLIGFTVLLTFWIFSLALSAFNALFSLTQLSGRVPFPQPGVTTILSFGALVVAGIVWLLRRGGRPRANRGAPKTVPAEATARSEI